MNVLLVYPEHPDTFWSFKHALKFIAKKAAYPPLGLLTVAAMLPKQWNLKLIDMNVEKLKDRHIAWADMVFISAMTVQRSSVKALLERLRGVTIVAGGPLFTAYHDDFPAIDHFILNEAELTLPPFLKDLAGGSPRRVYTTQEFPSLEETPVPLWHLAAMRKYSSMNIQYSRGCPFQCEFCDITTLFGRRVRTKAAHQVIAELESLYQRGWRGEVFFVDDNFIGNKAKLKSEVLPAITAWMQRHHRPFRFLTEASINLADDDDLMRMMVAAGFFSVFIGIETPDAKSLAECNKIQNKDRNLVLSVERIQESGLEVTAGFIVGFDSDTPSTFVLQAEFIKRSRIVTAMVGLLNAPKGTPLYLRLKKEDRIVDDITGDNTDLSVNFKPKMKLARLKRGYRKIIADIYAAKPYYTRVRMYLSHTRHVKKSKFHFKLIHLGALFSSIFVLGVKDKERWEYWKLMLWSLFTSPKQFPAAVTFAIYGYHFRTVFAAYL